MSAAAGAIVLVGRVLYAWYFGLVAGVGHIRRSNTYEEMTRSRFPIPSITGWPAGFWLVVGASSIAFGIWPDVGSLMIVVFVIPAAYYFHAFWKVEDPAQRRTQNQLLWRNAIIVGAGLMMFGTFVSLGPALRFTITPPLFNF